jgi:3-methyladenine DNA glycosylase AlkD
MFLTVKTLRAPIFYKGILSGFCQSMVNIINQWKNIDWKAGKEQEKNPPVGERSD